MKNTLFYIIILAVVGYVIYRLRKPAAKPTATTTTETPSNSGLFVPANESDDDTGTVDPGEPQPATTEKTTTENCPYCGTPNAIVTRVYKNGKVIKMTVMCGNKSCPGGYGKVKKAEIIANDSKFVKPQTGR